MYSSGKTFAYDYVLREEVVTFAKKTDRTLNIRVDSQRRSLNRILLLFIESYAAGARYSEKYVNLEIKSDFYEYGLFYKPIAIKKR